MELSIVEDYPTGAAFGCDYFSLAAQGDIVEEGPDGPVVRREKIVITDRYNDYEGQVCVGERTIRHLAHAFGMIDGWRVARITDDNAALRAELVVLSQQVAKLHQQVVFLEEMEKKPPDKHWLALDGTEHASHRGAQEATAAMVGLELAAVTGARPMPVRETVSDIESQRGAVT